MNIKYVLKKLKQALNKVLGFIPTKTPVGVTEFNSWAQSIIDTYAPAADDRSVKFALCAMLMRLDPTAAYKSKRFFALCLHKGAAAQVAAYMMQDIKNTQEAELKALQEASEKAATLSLVKDVATPPSGQEATNVIPIQNS